MEALEQIKTRIEAAVPGAKIDIVTNGSPSAQHSFKIDNQHAREVAKFLRDWLDRVVKKTVKVKQVVDGVEKDVDQTSEETFPGYLEAIYHLFSIAHRHGPVIIRTQTDRIEPELPSLTPVWRSAELQEREIFDLYGIEFEGHPDLRRILMWDEFEDFPMRKDYTPPDDFEWEPTPHDDVLARAKEHYSPRPATDGAEALTNQQ
jgi:NADH-quinone oxidoreductase subunit C